ARRMSAVAELLALRTAQIEHEDADPGYMVITGFQRTAAEVAAAMNLSPSAASSVVTHADALQNRLPAVGIGLATGDTDWPTVKLIIARTEFVNDSVIARLDENLARRIAKWHCWSRKSSTGEAAALLGLSRRSVQRMARAPGGSSPSGSAGRICSAWRRSWH